jgi:Calcium binding
LSQRRLCYALLSMPRKVAKKTKRSGTLSDEIFRGLVEDATVDAYGEEAEANGWLAMIDDNVGFPFDVELLGTNVTVVGVDMTDAYELVAICRRGKSRLKVSLLELPLPSPPPKGVEWVEAFQRWCARQG